VNSTNYNTKKEMVKENNAAP